MNIGILGLQGCTVPHLKKLKAIGVDGRRILYADDLDDVDGLILPGGESSTMLKAETSGLWEAIHTFSRKKPVWGICAGSILMATKVTNPEQDSLKIMDIDIVRNAYGAQNESFICTLDLKLDKPQQIEGFFIRAPQISRVGNDVRIRAEHNGNAVLVESDQHIISTFHPELTDSILLHEYFSEKVKNNQ